MFISEQIIEDVRNRSDIVEILSEYIVLKKTGRSYKCLCPFHNEKTPSFVVSPEKQIFHCFGCGAGGNVFNFLMKIEGLTFFEAVKKLSVKAGINLDSLTEDKEFSKENREKEDLFNLNEQVADYYHRYLIESKNAQQAREYLKIRKLSPQIIKKFKVGYAPKGSSLLVNLNRKKLYSVDLLKKGGLISFYSASQQYYDYFQERIIFPIYNSRGQVVAFGGRVISNDKKPKYLNSPDTLLYNKSKTLYGLNLASRAIRSQNQVVILEGYIDVLSAHQYGIENTVATLGTSLTMEHIHLLKRYAEEVLINYDADAPGISATLRGLDLLIDSGLSVKVVSLPSGKDPDDFLHENGKEAFIEILRKSLSLVDYRMNLAISNVDIHTTEGKVYVIKEVLPIIERIKNAIEQREEIKKLSQRLSLDEELIFIELSKIKSKDLRSSNLNKIILTDTLGVEKAQREIIQIMLLDSNIIGKVKQELCADDFDVLNLSVIVDEMFKLSPNIGDNLAVKLIDSLQDEQLSQIIAQLLLADKKYIEKEKTVEGLIKTIKQYNLKKKYAKLEEELKNILSRNEQPSVETLQKYNELVKVLKGSRRN